jgi:hypothetical protein
MAEIVTEDALAWLATYAGAGAIVTRPPGPESMQLEPLEWAGWFSQVLAGCFIVGNPVVLQISDLPRMSTCEMVFHMARHIGGAELVWHKIALDGPRFSHVMAFGDCSSPIGPQLLEHAKAPAHMVEFAAIWARPIIDPFCDDGAVLEAADRLGIDALGIRKPHPLSA